MRIRLRMPPNSFGGGRHDAMNELFVRYAQNMIALWRRHYPGYEESLRALSEEAVQEHYQRIFVAWACEKLAWEFARASQMRWPFRNRFWLEYMLNSGIPIEMIAAQSRVPTIVVRLFARSIVGRGWLWVLTGKDRLARAPQPENTAIGEQVRFEDRIFLRPARGKIFVPAEGLFEDGSTWQTAHLL